MMGKCSCSKLCPVSFGLALGLTGALGVLVWAAWIMYHGVPPEMPGMPMPDWSMAFANAFATLIKGFVFGFFIALFYDFFSGCVMRKLCKKSDGCGCGPASK